MSALVWSVESAILGVWALVFSFYSTPFHAFIARSHSIIAGFTLLLQLIATARDLPVGHAIAEAFVCAVSALLLVYAAALLDTANHARFFSMPAAGLFPLDAAIGVAWFCAAGVSATGMALSGVGKTAEDGRRRRASLMFHQYGYHMSIVLPSLLILWLYNYDASNTGDPVYKGVKFVRNNDVTIGHTLLFLVYAGIWGVFVVAQFLGEGVFTGGKQWPAAWSEMSAGGTAAYIFAALLKFIGRGGCVLLPLSAVWASKTYAQMIMAWTLVGVAAVYAVDLMSVFDRLTGKATPESEAGEQEEEGNNGPSAPHMDAIFAPASAAMLYKDTPTTIPAHIGSQQDPAAVAMGGGGLRPPPIHQPTAVLPLPRYQPLPSQARREKMV